MPKAPPPLRPSTVPVTGRAALVCTAALIAGPALLGCGSSSQQGSTPQARSQWTDRDTVLFDNGADYLGQPDALGGRWRVQWEKDMSDRMQAGDVVAAVRVRTVRLDLDRHKTERAVRLFVDPLRVYVAPEGYQLASLTSAREDAGFTTLAGKDERLLNHDFVLCLKWRQLPDEEAAQGRWHLSPATKNVMQLLAPRLRALGEQSGSGSDSSNRVIVHENP